MSDVSIVCDSGHTWLDPRLGPGQVGAQSDTVWQLATYRGKEGFDDLDKCYWNLAVGLDVGPEGNARDCRLLGQATASNASFGVDQRTPPNTVYPFVEFDVTLTNSDAEFVCGANPLNGPGSGVNTRYTPASGRYFPGEWRCGGDQPVPEGRILCDAQSGPEPGTFIESPAGIAFSHGDATSPQYRLPQGLKVKSCCGNPCPGCQP